MGMITHHYINETGCTSPEATILYADTDPFHKKNTKKDKVRSDLVIGNPRNT